ncbi:unnamed protein product [Echinostoma caproni]|uniref:Endo/exonuclease/phosphatase domain-containing protein n=1 Tax=Echinostoma caproni TaxID=27848 RepID=A0A183AZZ3_9TREM|nr:unnamed protein product [Echinostoma caproni]
MKTALSEVPLCDNDANSQSIPASCSPPQLGDQSTRAPSPKKPMLADRNRVSNESTSHPKGLPHQTHLSFCYTNAQGLRSKFSELVLRFQSSQWDIIAVTETWLTNDILDSELCLPGMSLLRRDHPTRGGGVLLYHQNDLQCDAVDPPVSAPDTIWCKLKLSKHDDCLVGVVYHSPSSTESANDTFVRAMLQVLSAKFSHILIVGDFNCPHLDQTLTSHLSFQSQFKQLIDSHPLYNHMKEPTRFRNLATSSMDLVLTNEELMVESIGLTPLRTQ